MRRDRLVRIKSICFALTLCVTSSFIANISIEDVKALNNSEVTINQSSNSIVIGNELMSREFVIDNGHVTTKTITNKRTDGGNTTFSPAVGSENFVINTIPQQEASTEIKNPTKKLSTTGWTAKAANGQDASAVLDGNPSTKWEANSKPYEIILNMQSPKTFNSFSYQARQDGFKDAAGIWGINGIFKGYEVYVSDNGTNWNRIKSGDLNVILTNNVALNQYNRSNPVYVNFDNTVTTQYLKLVCTSQYNGQDFMATASELGLYEDSVVDPSVQSTKINSSKLTLEENGIKSEATETGSKLTFNFKPYNFNNVDWDIDYVVVMNNGDHFMRSFMEIKIPEAQQTSAKIDYIDTDHFILGTDVNVNNIWSRPDDMTSMWIRPYELSLGQPIYINGMFFGSEFPATDNDIKDKDVQIRYYSGKSFDKLEKTTDGKFVSWQNVAGAARSMDKSVVQADLFSYIDTIATETNFRKQYNSWYDNMMDITDANIEESFYEIEKGLTQNGVEPLDSYVVDDGWNAYETLSAGQPNKTPYDNKTGFWEFNNKFPNELYPSTSLASKLGSKFGLWLGPRGGYNYNDGFAQYLQSMGTGHYNANGVMNDICVGSTTYQKNLLNLFLDYQKKFDINYWKLDGFAIRPCTGTDHGHMTGGNSGMYFTSEMWENWTAMFDTMREQREAEGKDLWINLTCYANPSPWFLQWVNTVWLQDCGDNGFIDTVQNGVNKGEKLLGSDADQALTYRDDIYNNIFKRKDLQFPLKNVYNHDPIYGNTASNFITGKKVSMTDAEFKDYLYGNAVRGTSFWELYFSYNMMSEGKWMAASEVLAWAEKNHDILEKAQQIGGVPGNGEVYGYSSWNERGGILSIRNPRNVEQTFEVTLNNINGVPESMEALSKTQIQPYAKEAVDSKTYSYGDKISVTLKPHEQLIYQFGNKDNTTPVVEWSKNLNDKTIRVKFDKAIAINESSFKLDGTVIQGTLLADNRTVEIVSPTVIEGDSVNVEINVKDVSGNTLNTTINTSNYKDQVISSAKAKYDLQNSWDLTEVNFDQGNVNMMNIDKKPYSFLSNNGVAGKSDFSLSMIVKTTSTNTTLLKQSNGFDLSIDKDGYLNFEVNGLSVNSKNTETVKNAEGTFTNITLGKINDGNIKQINAVREANGMLKLYIDGKLIASKYDETNKNSEIVNAPITLGSETFTGLVGNVSVLNKALAFNEVSVLYSELNFDPLKEIPRTGWTATADSEYNGTNEGPARNAIDGNLSTWWHTNYGSNQPVVPHYITIDMGKENEFNRYEYVSRNGNGNIKDYTLQVSSDNQNWTKVAEGTLSNGGSSMIEFNTVTARYIKLTTTATYGSPANTFASAAELKVYLYKGLPINFANLANAIDNSSIYSQTGYTASSYAIFELALNEAKKVNNNVNSTQAEIDNALNNLNSGIAQLVVQVVNKDELRAKLNEVKEIKADNYTTASYEALKKAIILGEEVIANSEATQVDVDNAKATLENAKLLLIERGNKTELQATINRIPALAEEKYTVASWSAYKESLDKAILINSDIDAIQVDIDKAKTDLERDFNGLVLNEIIVAKVSNIKATVSSNSVKLTWNAPIYTAGLKEYVIYKDGKELARVKAGSCEYTADKLRANTIYGFKVTAVYENGEASKPVSINVRTSTLP